MDTTTIFNETWRIFIVRFFLNLILIIIISRFFYFSKGRGTREYLFTYISTSVIIFLICILII